MEHLPLWLHPMSYQGNHTGIMVPGLQNKTHKAIGLDLMSNEQVIARATAGRQYL